MTSSRSFSIPPNIQSSSITDFFLGQHNGNAEYSSHLFAFFSFIRQQTKTSKLEKHFTRFFPVTVLGGLSGPFRGSVTSIWVINGYFEKNSKGFWNKYHCSHFLFVRESLKIWESLPSQKRLGDDPFLLGYGLFSEAKLFPKDPGMSWERDYIYNPILRMRFRPSILL